MEVADMDSLAFASRRRHRIEAAGDDISWGNAGNRDKKARREWVLDREDESDEDEEEGREQEVLLPLSVNTRKQPDTNTFIVLDSAKSSITENSGEHSPKRQRLCIHNNEDDNEIPEEVPRVVLESRNLAVQTSSHNDGARRMFQPPPSKRSCPVPFGIAEEPPSIDSLKL